MFSKIKELIALLLITQCIAEKSVTNQDLINSKVERNIDISTQLVKISTKVTLLNNGKTPVSYFLYTIDQELKPGISYVAASSHDDGRSNLKIAETSVEEGRDKSAHKVELKNPLQPGKTTTIEVETIFTNMLIPYPSHISQSDKQLVLFHGNHYFYSPYQTRTQTTTVTLTTNSFESYSKLKPVSQSENVITYGPYENIAPFSYNKMVVHYENNSPFLSVSKLQRTIEVSHWGVIAIEEEIDLRHTGAILKGPFSRYEFQRDQSGISAIKVFKTVLPASAVDIYYRDEIGNISTSHLRVLEDSVEVDLRPRFPLFGGWKTHYVLGYYVPTYEYLFNSGDYYVLKMRFIDHVFDDSVINDATVKIILPEGSKDIQLKVPYPVVQGPNELHYTYLDTIGRPVVVLHKSNLVEQHIQDFEVHYQFQKILMLQEPLLAVGALYLLFILVIIYVRLDFTITRDPLKESKLRVSGFAEHVHSHHDKRADIYGHYDEALNKFKTSKDTLTYQTTVKKLHNDHKNETQAIADLLNKLKNEGSEVADKVAELQRLDKSLKDQIQQQMVLVEKLIAGKMNKQQYLDSEAAILRKKEEIAERTQAVLISL